MSDIMKDPIQPQANPTPQPAKSNNTGLIIVIIVVVILFFLPLAFMFFIFLFIASVVDNIDYNLDYGDDIVLEEGELTADQTKSLRSIWLATQDERLAENGVSQQDCRNLRRIAVSTADSDWFSSALCVEDVLNVNATYDGTDYTFYLSDGTGCATYVINGDMNELERYSITTTDTEGLCKDLKTIKMIDTDEEDEEDEEELDKPSINIEINPSNRT